jgi:AcrR family transcriptional regulator
MSAADTANATAPGTPNEASTGKRRRGSTLEAALLGAAWDELVAVGYADFTLEGVATRAQTSRPVLARRWPDRPALVRAALRHHADVTPIEVPDTGSLRSDVLEFLRGVTARVNEFAGVLSFVIADHFRESGTTPSAVRGKAVAKATSRDQALVGSITTMRRILDQASRRGEISSSALPDRLATLPVDLIFHELVTNPDSVSETTLIEVVDRIFLPLVAAQDEGLPQG